MEAPNLTGFAEAQERLRQGVGTDITFYVPQVASWPTGTVLDPETLRPHDPTIEPEEGGGLDEVVIRCNVAHRPVAGLNDDVSEEPIGGMEAGRVVLITAVENYDLVQAATEFDAVGDRHKITQRKLDGISGAIQRGLIWGERKRTIAATP